jgi:hypothetical protein
MVHPVTLPPIDLDDLAEAFADASATMPYFLDRQTGEILLVSDALGFIDAERQRLEMRDEPARWIPIPAAGDGWWFEVMEAFLATVVDERWATRLERALDSADPVRAWAKTVRADEALQTAWETAVMAAQHKRAAAWLVSIT